MTVSEEALVVGIDIGGANLKYWSSDGRARVTSFPLWKSPHRLSTQLIRDLESLLSDSGHQDRDTAAGLPSRTARGKPAAQLVITMTGELADCFRSRQAGVRHILDQVTAAASEASHRPVVVYGMDGCFHSPADAANAWELIASGNWHALACQAAREFPDAGLLIDIGSTTTDLIPLADGGVATTAKTDHARLAEGSLVYVGCRRTPVCSLVDSLLFRGVDCAVMNELFATIDDARLLLGTANIDPTDCDTADGAPRTLESAGRRLARMIGLDFEQITSVELQGLAAQIILAAARRISASLRTLAREPAAHWIIAGHGDDLIDSAWIDPGADRRLVKLADRWGAAAARCAPSRAVAILWQQS